MAAYTSTQSGNFSNPATWGGSGYPDTDGDTFTVAAGHVVTYDITTPLTNGLGSSVVNSGGTFIMDNNTSIRFDGTSTYHFACSGNLIIRPGAKTLLKGTTASNRVYDIRPLTFVPTTATGTSGQNTITVASNANQLYVGNKVSGTGIRAGVYITNINGNTITLSGTNTGTVSGNLTVGNYVEIIGSEGMPITTVGSAVTTGNYQQGYIVAASASNFVAGDWIAVYERGVVDALADRNDEGFIVHDISGNNIYIREFVGPSATISAVEGNTITVSNAKVFRTWQSVIFGTGANRNIHKIISIDEVNNIVGFGSAVSGSVIGETVYTTGPLQIKAVGDKIRKCATTVATQAASNATQITLSSVAGLSVGDEIIIDARWDVTATSYTDELPEKRNITAINGNTVTLNQSLGYIAFVGAFVVRVTRDIKFIGDYETTLVTNAAHGCSVGDVITQAYSGARGVVKTVTNSTTVVIHDIFGQFIAGSTNSPWLSRNGTPIATNVFCSTVTISTTQGHSGFGFARSAAFTSNQLPVLYFRDVEVATFSNADLTSSRLWLRGYWSTHTNAIGGVEIEGITYCKPNQTDNFNYLDNAIWANRYWHDLTVRCCVAWNTINGLYFQEGYDLRNGAAYNNYLARSEGNLLIWQHMANDGTLGGAHECSYNYLHRGDDIGLNIGYVRTSARGIHHNWVNVSQSRPINFDLTYTQGILYQNRFQHFFEWIYPIASNEHNLIYNEWIPATNLYDFTLDGNFQTYNQSVTFTNSIVSLEHNYESDAVTIFINGGKRDWDNNEKAWRCVFDDDYGALQVGLAEVYYIPANATLRAKATIKLDPNFNGTAPKFEIRGCMDRFYVGANGSYAGEQPFRGFSTSANFNAANTTTYQSLELTFDPKPWGRSVTVGVISVNSNANVGWWEKPIEIKYDNLPSTPFINTGINNFSSIISSGTDFTTRKIRFGGSII